MHGIFAITCFRPRTGRGGPGHGGAAPTLHLRFNDLADPQLIPHDTDYASVFESDVPIIVQHTRLDSRRADFALLLNHGLFGGLT